MFDDILFIPLGHEYCHISAAALCQRGGSFLAAGGSVRAHASGLLQHQSCRYVGVQLTVSSTSKQAHVSRAMIPAGTPFPDTVSQEFRTTPVFQNGNESARISVDRMPRSPVGLRRTQRVAVTDIHLENVRFGCRSVTCESYTKLTINLKGFNTKFISRRETGVCGKQK